MHDRLRPPSFVASINDAPAGPHSRISFAKW
jgi:hypothetical protein